jgi:hypothetical protein
MKRTFDFLHQVLLWRDSLPEEDTGTSLLGPSHTVPELDATTRAVNVLHRGLSSPRRVSRVGSVIVSAFFPPDENPPSEEGVVPPVPPQKATPPAALVFREKEENPPDKQLTTE